MRRRTLVLGGIVVAAAAALAASWLARRQPIAVSEDGTVELFAAAYGPRFEFWVPRAGWRRVLGRMKHGGGQDSATLWIWSQSKPLVTPHDPEVAGRCGCRFHLLLHLGFRTGDAVEEVRFAPTFPRRDRELTIRFPSYDATVRFASPAPPPPPASDTGVEELPVSIKLGDETWVLAPDPDPAFVVLRAVDANRNGIEWPMRGGLFRDASGNEVHRAAEPSSREHRIRLPLADDMYHLCPHEPWWELELDVAAGRTVTFRFRPPRPDVGAETTPR